METEKKTIKKFFLLDGTTAILIANGYQWACPACGEGNYTIAASAAVGCSACLLVFRVKEVRHWSGQEALLPGTKPGQLFKPAFSKFRSVEDEDAGSPVSLHDAVGEVCLTASGYAWRCPECDNVNYSPEITFGDVRCLICRSSFEVSEARHRTSFGDLGIRVHPGAVWLTREVGTGEDDEDGSQPDIERLPRTDDHTSFVG